jgi:predicted nucleic-acid-binding protein
MRFVDTNIILRYILNDHDELSPAAKNIIENNEIFLLTEVIAEVVYVLSGVYDVARKDVSESLNVFINDAYCTLADSDIITRALNLFGETSFDFVDCVLAAYAEAGNEVSTFDKKLSSLCRALAGEPEGTHT